MPKPKWNLNTVYISERLQESLRPVSRCALTTVVAPMGYGKTTAVNWYLEARARLEPVKMIRVSVYSDNLAILWKSILHAFPEDGQIVSVYSDNLAILWKSVQDAFARAGFGFMRDCDCPEDAASGGLLADEMVTPQLRALVRRLEEFANNGKVGGLILRGGELTLALNTSYVFANVPNAIDMRDIDGIRKWFTDSLTGMAGLLDILRKSPALTDTVSQA